MTDPTADAAKLLPCPFPWRGDDGTVGQCVERGHCGCNANTRPQLAPPAGEPEIVTAHFHGQPRKLSVVLHALAAQEGNDGDEGKTMQAAGDYIAGLAARPKVEDADTENFGPGSWRRLLSQLRTSKSALAEREAELAKNREQIAEQIVLGVAEIPDRDSPDDQPEMMLVTDKELRNIVLRTLDYYAARQQQKASAEPTAREGE